MTATNEISVPEALHKTDSGESVKAYTISLATPKLKP